MKIQPDKFDVQSVNAYSDEWISIDGVTYNHSVVFNSAGQLWNWDCSSFLQLSVADFVWLASLEPKILILGTGRQQIFPAVKMLKPLIQVAIGYEIMTSSAACRTYNILAQEGRQVMCAVII